jgi:hypothetical protein
MGDCDSGTHLLVQQLVLFASTIVYRSESSKF